MHSREKTVIVLSRSMSPDRSKKEKVMDDLQYLHYQTQLEEQQYAELDSDGSVLPTVRTQADDRNKTSNRTKKSTKPEIA